MCRKNFQYALSNNVKAVHIIKTTRFSFADKPIELLIDGVGLPFPQAEKSDLHALNARMHYVYVGA